MGKATHDKIDQWFLDYRFERAHDMGFEKAKWIYFCETLLKEGYELWLYEARKTYSKYITVKKPGDKREYIVRFSNHKPIRAMEEEGTCNFWVGVTHFGVTTTQQGLEAVRAFFGGKDALR